ncbi:hypothetical protein A6V27_20910 (plasmid) [Hafnia alvei]|nr:hypothetical protein A6V27_20910 [Hafnia alvei]KID00491.1 hypothetical protein PU00_17005 [Hafnia alvei]TBL89252.1 hypothetical protein EYY88_03570 [Hafnia alvei]
MIVIITIYLRVQHLIEVLTSIVACASLDKRLEARRGFLKTTVALANKLTEPYRVSWRIFSPGTQAA